MPNATETYLSTACVGHLLFMCNLPNNHLKLIPSYVKVYLEFTSIGSKMSYIGRWSTDYKIIHQKWAAL